MRTHKLIPLALLLPVLSLAPIRGLAQDAGQNTGQGSGDTDPVLTKYPLRLHVLAIDSTSPTARMQPNWCSMSVPAMGADVSAGADSGGSPCGGGGSSATFGGSDDFSGTGRGDLVSPPTVTQGVTFTYDGCSRMRVPPGFTSLPARWKRGGKLEVLVPSDAIGRATNRKCTLSAKTHEFVYLRMRTGALLMVSQEAYTSKPSLRVFLSGGGQTLQPRTPQTVSVKQLMTSPH